MAFIASSASPLIFAANCLLRGLTAYIVINANILAPTDNANFANYVTSTKSIVLKAASLPDKYSLYPAQKQQKNNINS